MVNFFLFVYSFRKIHGNEAGQHKGRYQRNERQNTNEEAGKNHYITDFENKNVVTTNGKSQEIPEPLCRAAIVVGPPKEGIQKKPSVSRPFY